MRRSTTARSVLGVTLSEEQIALAREKAERLGLADRVTFEKRDYALMEGDGRFDKITSVGMFEHVGLANFETYFQTVQRLLKPGGLYLHHAITRPGGSRAARTGRKPPEFKALTRYIFPGGELDYLGRTDHQSRTAAASRSATSNAGASITG